LKYRTVYAICFLPLFLLLVGCKPNAEQQARIDEQRREHMLNTIQETDVLPKIDYKTQTVLKRGGKFFIAPKEYFRQGNMHGFFWPSKSPKFGKDEDHPEREAVKAGKIDAVEVAFYIESQRPSIDVSAIIAQQLLDRRIKTEKIRTGLERGEVALDPTRPNSTDLFYIATKLRTHNDSGPPAIACYLRENGGTASTTFEWKSGLTVSVRMAATHCKDWPEIYTEIIRVLNLVKEA
jgi:hypothetical protein